MRTKTHRPRSRKASTEPKARFSPNKILFSRVARRLLWPHPSIYFPVGIARKRGNVFGNHIDIYISGYPRSGNTFSCTAFRAANPNVRIQSHRHIPTFVIQKVQAGVPGIVLIRKPMDAAISWSMHSGQAIEEAVAYWNDYYETLMSIRSKLFVATFDDVVSDFGAVMRCFNERYGTSFVPFVHTPKSTDDCFRVTEEDHREPDGNIREMQVCRPSPVRRKVKERLLREAPQSAFLRDELAFANDIYRAFVNYRLKSERRLSSAASAESTGSVLISDAALG